MVGHGSTLLLTTVAKPQVFVKHTILSSSLLNEQSQQYMCFGRIKGVASTDVFMLQRKPTVADD